MVPGEYRETDDFRNASFVRCDLTGVEIRDCDVTKLRIVDSYVHEVDVSGQLRNVVVNDVDVTAFVEAELDRVYPERVLLREAQTAAELRNVRTDVNALWAATIERARTFPMAALHERVYGEWSFVETQRHLLFASDAWVGSAVLQELHPHHRFGLPSSGYPADKALAIGLALGVKPSLDEVLAARATRAAVVDRLFDELSDDELQRVCGAKPSPEYPDEPYLVGRCVRTVLREELEHRRYVERDLSRLARP